MTDVQQQRRADRFERTMNILIVVGVCLAVFALVRDWQTRALIDRPARAVAQKICASDNQRWNAYLTAAVAASNKQASTESDAAYEARRARTAKIIGEIRQVVTVNCTEAFQP